MSNKKKKNKKPTADDILKYEIASTLGLSDKVDSIGWGGLTAAETGRIGGLLSAKKRQMKKQVQREAEENHINTLE